jgi:high affinity Mn2+ porin
VGRALLCCVRSFVGAGALACALFAAGDPAAAVDPSNSMPPGRAMTTDVDVRIPVKAPVASPVKVPAAPLVLDPWTGFYVGTHVGYSRGFGRSTLFDPEPSRSEASFGSLFGGFQVGYNFLLPSRFLLGVEGDITFPYFLNDGTVTLLQTPYSLVTDRLDFVSTLRGRVGYAFDHWLFYATGGVAGSLARFLEDPGLNDDEDKVLRLRAGWAAGAGAEFAIGKGWTARLEYLYDHLDHAGGTFPSGTGYESTAMDIRTIRLGLNRQFDWAGPAADHSIVAGGGATEPDSWNVHGQLTYIEQGYPTFRSLYEGPNSLTHQGSIKDTVSATVFLGVRPWEGTEIYVNPEFSQGFGLSQTLGVAGFPNEEAQKVGFPMPRLDIARAYVQQTFGLGGEQETVGDGPNQLAGTRDVSRITLTAGRFSVPDFFDGNAYSHDARTSFMNWNLYCCGSYDWTMDQPSYGWGAFADLNQKNWAFRAGYFLEPRVSNTNNFDMNIPTQGQYVAELELRYSLLSEPRKLRLFGWVTHANMGSYAAALAMPTDTPNYPDITQTRDLRTNYGYLVNIEQAITDDLGVFSRASWSPGLVEIMGWTDVDESLSFGTVLKGTAWGRPDDRIGIGGLVDGLSSEARAYFAAGGAGILIGDGNLNYRPEKILEAYYSYSINKWSAVTFDYQFVDNPAYNADRGPVSIFSGRYHAEF